MRMSIKIFPGFPYFLLTYLEIEKIKSVKLKGMKNFRIRVTKDYVFASNM